MAKTVKFEVDVDVKKMGCKDRVPFSSKSKDTEELSKVFSGKDFNF